jgi:hypothetical protein
VDGVIGTGDDVDGGEGGVPVARNNENGFGAGAESFVLPSFQEMPCRNGLIYTQRRRSMRYILFGIAWM